MRLFRGSLLIVLLVLPAACNRGSSSGGGGGAPPPPAPPPGPPQPVITSPASPLGPAFLNVPVPSTNFTGTGTGTFAWTVTGGSLPPGVTLSLSGVYSGTPTVPGLYTFTVTLTDDNGTDAGVFTQTILASVPELEPNEDSGNATELPAGVPGTGGLGADDIDFWSFTATADQVVRIEVFALRRDFDNWLAAGEIPRISLFGIDGTGFLTGIDIEAGTTTFWSGGMFDLDIPQFRIPVTGTYFIRLDHYTAGVPGGEYALRVGFVDLGVLQVESEANNAVAAANAISPGTIRATRVDGDDDFFSFTISSPSIVTFEVFAYRNGVGGVAGSPDDDFFDPQIELLDTDGIAVLASNDDAFFFDPALQFVLTGSGTYFLRVTESLGFGSDGDTEYFLTFSEVPLGTAVEFEPDDETADATPMAYDAVVNGQIDGADVDFYSFSGTAGDMVRVFFFDFGSHQDAADLIDIQFMLDDSTFIPSAIDFTGVAGFAVARAILPSTGTFFIRVVPQGGPTDYAIRLVRHLDATFETEGNDTTGTADPVPVSGRVAGVIEVDGDEDVFSFSAEEGEIVNFSIYAARGEWAFRTGVGFVNHDDFGSLLLPNLEILDPGGTVIDATPFFELDFTGESMSNGLAGSGVTLRAPLSGTYYVRVLDIEGFGGPEFLYLLEKE